MDRKAIHHEDTARLDVEIAVMEQKIDHLAEVVSKHMDYEEKQRDKLEYELNGIGRRVGGLNKLVWLVIGMVGGPELISIASQLPLG